MSAGLGQQYRHIHVLKGNDATLAKFKSALQTAGNVAGVAAVDVMFNTHGSSDKVHFKDGAKSTTTVKDSLNVLSAGVPRQMPRRLLHGVLRCHASEHVD